MLHQIILVVVLTSQLHAILALGYLPTLENNKLKEGAERELPNARPLYCGGVCITDGTIKEKVSLSEVFRYDAFKQHAFTAGPVAAQGAQRINGDTAGFSFIKIKGSRHTQFALEVDMTAERAFWLPQGGTIDIPKRPARGQPWYVFTPDFSGCSWTVTPISDTHLRIRHVEGGSEAEQFNRKSEEEKGGPVTYAMEYKDYGYVVGMRHLYSNVPAFAYMRYLPGGGGRWLLMLQRKTCADVAGGFAFNNHELSRARLVETSDTEYSPVNSTMTFMIPSYDFDYRNV